MEQRGLEDHGAVRTVRHDRGARAGSSEGFASRVLVAGESDRLGNGLPELGPEERRFHYRAEATRRGKGSARPTVWVEEMGRCAAGGYRVDLEENLDLVETKDRVRCVGAPVRDASPAIVVAVSVSSVAHSMTDSRTTELIGTVTDTANAISRELGWRGTRKRP